MKLHGIMIGAAALLSMVGSAAGWIPFVNEFVPELRQWNYKTCGSTQARGYQPWRELKHDPDVTPEDRSFTPLHKCVDMLEETESFEFRMGMFCHNVWVYSEKGCKGEGGGYQLAPRILRLWTTEYALNYICWNTDFVRKTNGTKRAYFKKVKSIMFS